jgi:hypothetical protein
MLLEFVAMTIKVMWFESTLIVEVLMLGQFDPHVFPQVCVLLVCICSPISVIANTYSWELASCGIDSDGFRLYFDTFFHTSSFL